MNLSNSVKLQDYNLLVSKNQANWYRKVLSYDSGHPEANYYLALNLEDKGQFKDAYKHYLDTKSSRKYIPDEAYGKAWLGLSIPHYGIHGTNNPSIIGRNVTLGCINMNNADVLELYNLAPVGTPVIIE